MFRIIALFTWLLAIVAGQHILDFPDAIDKSQCIPLSRLQDASVQRGLGELRRIQKVNVYITGNGTVDMVVSVATNFTDDDFTKPLSRKCEDYQGTADNVLLSLNCIDNSDPEGFDGYAVFVKFYGDLIISDAAICQVEIFLQDKEIAEKRQMVRSTAITFGVVCSLILLAGVCVIVWYYFSQRTEITTGETHEDIAKPHQEPRSRLFSRMVSDNRTCERNPTMSNGDDYDDEVFILG